MLAPGTLVAERFEIESLAGSGGMGMVFRARDRYTGVLVALKVLSSNATVQDTERFLREAQVLSELSHPGIVAYVAHGRTLGGLFYLALEWLSGEDLAQRLARQPLTVAESLVLVRGVANALTTMHRHGVVHRDIKPSNLLLRDGRVERVTLLDFGIARGGKASWSVTPTGEVVGTLHYIAPEQARGERLVTTSADVFALGCVLFECLTGSPPFAGEHVAMVLTRIMYEEVPPLRRLRPELPEVLEKLLGRMLTKQPEQRLGDGTALLTALSELELPEQMGLSNLPPPHPPLATEQQLVSVVMAMPLLPVGNPTKTLDLSQESGQTAKRQAELQQKLQPFGAKVEGLPGGTILVTLVRDGEPATDLSAHAARAALTVRESMPEAAVVVTTGRGVMGENALTGEAIERATHLLVERTGQGVTVVPEIWLDELTVRLLDTRFRVGRGAGGLAVLEGRRLGPGETMRIQGPATNLVGREQELQMLRMLFGGCTEEGGARAVLLTGAPGAGKSRLRRELLRVIAAEEGAAEIWLGRGEPVERTTAYGMLGRVVLDLCGVKEGDEQDPGQARTRIGERVARQVVLPKRQQVTEGLGELCGLTAASEGAQGQGARSDTGAIEERVSAAWVEFLAAECAAHPVVLVLEDLQWSDAASLRLVDVALRELGDRPLLVLALGRPEVKELFPGLWEGRSFQEIRLPGLSRKASERLVRDVLRERATPEVVTRIVAQSEGNALLLEELIRAAMEDGGELPDTVLAVLQARFLKLEPGARRVLRAASIFGETFWRGGLLDLLGPERQTEDEIDRWLGILVDGGAVVRSADSRFANELQFAFRHGLLRDAAYSLVPEGDRRVGHRLAGGYLERVGERDPRILADHFERGGEMKRAAMYHAQILSAQA